jgi:hypothetical protein
MERLHRRRPKTNSSRTTLELLAERPLPATSLDRLVGPGRNHALIRSSLELVKSRIHLTRL